MDLLFLTYRGSGSESCLRALICRYSPNSVLMMDIYLWTLSLCLLYTSICIGTDCWVVRSGSVPLILAIPSGTIDGFHREHSGRVNSENHNVYFSIFRCETDGDYSPPHYLALMLCKMMQRAGTSPSFVQVQYMVGPGRVFY
jgi:hypothetical protein